MSGPVADAVVEERHRRAAWLASFCPPISKATLDQWCHSGDALGNIDLMRLHRSAQAIANAERVGMAAGLREGFKIGERWIGWKTADEAREVLEERLKELEGT